MDPFMAREIVETLSKGIDPLTGRALPQQDVCANEEVQDALLVVLKHCAIESSEQFLVRVRQEKKAAQEEKKKRNAEKYPRGGEPWSPEEERQLVFLRASGYNIYRIANSLKRTPGAIADRLKKIQSTPVRRK